jgi:flavin reductase (DIM6/NTAB) family NADH-FMN oxidoreductase RutF
MTMTARATDQQHFRRTLGHLPTGVVVVTALEPEGSPAGMSVGSFCSVSLEPPKVAFFPARTSTSWPRIERAGAFCVNILTASQEHVCRAFARQGGDKFEGLSWAPSAMTGSPVFDGVSGWVDCEIEDVIEAGDHFIVLGDVLDLDAKTSEHPLIFYRGGYGRFSPS